MQDPEQEVLDMIQRMCNGDSRAFELLVWLVLEVMETSKSWLQVLEVLNAVDIYMKNIGTNLEPLVSQMSNDE